MERTDSASTGMASLVEMYEEHSEEEEDSPDAPSAVDNISDEDEVDRESSSHSSRPPSRPIFEDDTAVSSPLSLPVKPAMKRKTTRLVSYGPDGDEEEGDSEEDSSPGEEGAEDEDTVGSEAIIVDNDVKPEEPLDADQASSLSRSVQNKTADEIELPAEPPGKCSKALQDKISKLYDKMQNQGLNLNYMNNNIKQRKNYRNPSIYEKLIEFCGIDEKGTNYPPEIFDPHQWGKESFYDALDKAQKTEMEKREKERKDRTKIEFVTGTKKSSSDGGPDEKKRKSKWDSLPQVTGTRPGVVNPPVVVSSLTITATGTKTTVIPAVGNITKKSKS